VLVILVCLDKILDYLPLEDLSRMTAVNKFFCYTATLERLYEKFDIDETESFIESSLGDLTENYSSSSRLGKYSSKRRLKMTKTDGAASSNSKEKDDLLSKSNLSNITLELLKRVKSNKKKNQNFRTNYSKPNRIAKNTSSGNSITNFNPQMLDSSIARSRAIMTYKRESS